MSQSEKDADSALHDPEDCTYCGDPIDTMPGEDDHLELTRYKADRVISIVFCNGHCLKNWKETGGLLQ